MVERLVNEISIDLHNCCYISALTTALTLPDICGKAKYPNEKSTAKRYKQWLNDYVCLKQPFGLQADADIIYDLRCKLLHDGNPSIDKTKLKIKQFALIVRENSAHIPLESSCIEEKPDGSKECHCYNINLVFLCEKICEAALTYYQADKDKFNFFDYRIINTDDETARTLGLPEDVIKVKL
ncbi:MAG: hypothetical protein J1F33_01210 [Clostridiales bacterium]|nr:hypothetical protein [Clostridiales bacterium]